MYLINHPEEEERIRKAARYTASRFTWERITENLIHRGEYEAKAQWLITMPDKTPSTEKSLRDFIRVFPESHSESDNLLVIGMFAHK